MLLYNSVDSIISPGSMENAGKRSLDDDSPETVGDDPKRLKIDCDLQVPSMDNTPIPEVKDVNKWKLLPSILCELFTLFKSSNAAKDQPVNSECCFLYDTYSLCRPKSVGRNKCILPNFLRMRKFCFILAHFFTKNRWCNCLDFVKFTYIKNYGDLKFVNLLTPHWSYNFLQMFICPFGAPPRGVRCT